MLNDEIAKKKIQLKKKPNEKQLKAAPG